MNNNYPLVTVVTPNYNCAQYLEQTILSVISQENCNIEHIVIDGGSNDGSIEILQKYSGKLKWVSEKDSGMYDAINKGFSMCSGEIFTYLNADDMYYDKHSVSNVTQEFIQDASIDFSYGHCAFVNNDGEILYTYKAMPFNRKISIAYPRNLFQQPTCFWRKRVHIGFDSRMKFSGDAKFFRMLCQQHVGRRINYTLARFRVRKDCLSFMNRESMRMEDEQIFGKGEDRKCSLYYRIIDIVYIRLYLNAGANIRRFILMFRREPYI